jgi:hypothetical protein
VRANIAWELRKQDARLSVAGPFMMSIAVSGRQSEGVTAVEQTRIKTWSIASPFREHPLLPLQALFEKACGAIALR